MNVWEILDALLGNAQQPSGAQRSGPASRPAQPQQPYDRPVEPGEWREQFREQWDRAKADSEAVFEKARTEMREHLDESHKSLHEAVTASQADLSALKHDVESRLTSVDKSLETLAIQAEDAKRLERKLNVLLGMAAGILLMAVYLVYRVANG